MLLGSALIYVYLVTGLWLAVIAGMALDDKTKLPAKVEREVVKMEKQMWERGIEREVFLLLLVLMWPALLVNGEKK